MMKYVTLCILVATAQLAFASTANHFPMKVEPVWTIQSPGFYFLSNPQIVMAKDGSCTAAIGTNLIDSPMIFAKQFDLCTGAFIDRLSFMSGYPTYPPLSLSASDDLSVIAMGNKINMSGKAISLELQNSGESNGVKISPDGKFAANHSVRVGVVPTKHYVELFSLKDQKFMGAMEAAKINEISWAKDSSHVRVLKLNEKNEVELVRFNLDLSQTTLVLPSAYQRHAVFSPNGEYVVHGSPRRFYEIGSGNDFAPGFDGATSDSVNELLVADTFTKGVGPSLKHFLTVWSSKLGQSKEVQRDDRGSIWGINASSKILVVGEHDESALTVYDLNDLERATKFKPCLADKVFGVLLVGRRLLVTCESIPSREKRIILYDINK